MTQGELFTDDPIAVNKAAIGFRVEDSTFYGSGTNLDNRERRKRGMTVYNYSALVSQAARDRYGKIQDAQYLIPYFSLTISERIDIARACGPIFGVVSGRMNTISGLEWKVVKKTVDEDRIAQQLKTAKQLFDEHQSKKEVQPQPMGMGAGPGMGEMDPMASPTPLAPPSPEDLDLKETALNAAISGRSRQFIKQYLPDILEDLSNFDRALLRWSHRIKSKNEDFCTEIEDWLRHPNQEDTFEDFTKKLIFDEHVHGIAIPYKKRIGRRIEQLYVLPGGSSFPIHGRHVGEAVGVVQIVDGAEAQLYYGDEVGVLQYAPYSGDPYGLVPLEALVNKVAEVLMFDERAAMMADGTKPPDKLIAFGENTPWGSLNSTFDMPMEPGERKRMEAVINEWRKEAVRVISGHGTPQVVDISRSDTFQFQSERQRMVREEVGLVFGASNAEMNLTGSESNSGRNSSKQQQKKDQYKGVYPHLQLLENFWNFQILPFRYSDKYEFKFDEQMSEADQIDFWTKKMQSGLFSVNEIRREDIGIDGFDDVVFDKPQGGSQPSQEGMGQDMMMSGIQ